jgi:hypothetical protein
MASKLKFRQIFGALKNIVFDASKSLISKVPQIGDFGVQEMLHISFNAKNSKFLSERVNFRFKTVSLSGPFCIFQVPSMHGAHLQAL